MQERSAKVKRVQHYVRKHQDRQVKKKRSAYMAPIKLTVGIMLAVVLVYFGVQIYSAINVPMEVVTALSTTVNEELSGVGYFIRREIPIEAEPEGILHYTSTDGEKLHRFEQYANVYEDDSAVETTKRIQAYDKRIATLENALNYSSSSDESGEINVTEQLAGDIYEMLLQVSDIADDGNYTLMTEETAELESLIINRDFAFTSASELQSAITLLKRQREALKSTIGERESALYAPYAGYFSSVQDGYEDILTPAIVDNLDSDKLRAIVSRAGRSLEGTVGKMVTDYSWYFVCPLRGDEAAKLTVGKTYQLRFSATGDLLIDAQVHAINKKTGSDPLVVFKSDRELTRLINLRRQAVHIILSSYSGLKVPREALRMDDKGNMGVYVITGMYAEFKKIEPIYESREFYIVKTNPTSTRSLLVYDEIIVSARKLANRKVIA